MPISPRSKFCDEGNPNNLYITYNDIKTKGDHALGYNFCLMFFDTQIEKRNELGLAWPYEPLADNQCLLSSDYA